MRKRLRSISNGLYPLALLACLVLAWCAVSGAGLVPAFMLPSPGSVLRAFWRELPLLLEGAAITLSEGFLGLFFGVAGAFLFATAMDHSGFLHRSVYPILLLTQTVPTIAVAPLLVLWLGYGMTPKVTLVFLTCFFPVTIGLLGGYASADRDAVRLLQTMGAGRLQIFWHIKLPSAMPSFFSGLKLSVTYSMVGAVVAEWLGGNGGLGVYMTRVRKSYSYDKMFAVILFISVLSLLLMRLTAFVERKSMPWKVSEGS